jgi:hypothetical protein
VTDVLAEYRRPAVAAAEPKSRAQGTLCSTERWRQLPSSNRWLDNVDFRRNDRGFRPIRLKKTALARALRASPLLRPTWTRRRSSGLWSHSSVNKVRSTRPSSRSASAKLFCRGYDPSFRSISDAVTVPHLIDAPKRKISRKCCSISLRFSEPPIKGASAGHWPGFPGT